MSTEVKLPLSTWHDDYGNEFYDNADVVTLERAYAELQERCKNLEQIASGNEERTALLTRKYGGETLTPAEEARLAALQELISAVIPRVTPDMMRASEERAAKQDAEIARLKDGLALAKSECKEAWEHSDNWNAAFAAKVKEFDELTERCTKAEKERDEARAEVARLKQWGPGPIGHALQNGVLELQAEIDRLKRIEAAALGYDKMFKDSAKENGKQLACDFEAALVTSQICRGIGPDGEVTPRTAREIAADLGIRTAGAEGQERVDAVTGKRISDDDGEVKP